MYSRYLEDEEDYLQQEVEEDEDYLQQEVEEDEDYLQQESLPIVEDETPPNFVEVPLPVIFIICHKSSDETATFC